MKKLFIIFSCLFFTYSQGQTVYKYYMYLNNSADAPAFTKQGNYMAYTGSDPGLQTFFSSYKIKDFSKAFPASNWESFSRVLSLETESSTLANELLTKYPGTYRKADNLTYKIPELTFYPNDYGTTSPNPNLGAPIIRDELDWMNVQKAWDITTGVGMTIGISDARINTTDQDYSGKVSFINPGSYQSLPYNVNNIETWHGTGIAGAAAAQGNNAYGSTGICYDCKIKGTAYGNYNNLLALAQSGVRVINMSWAYMSSSYESGYVEAHQMVVDSLVNHYKVVLVAAAGNQNSYQTATDKHCGTGFTGTQFGFPASYNGVISVSSVSHKHPLVLPLNTSQSTFCCVSPTNIPCYGPIQGSFGGTVDGTDPNHPVGIIFNGWPEYCDIGLPSQYISSPNGLVPRHTSNPNVDILAPTSGTFRFDIFTEQGGTISYTGAGTSGAAPQVSGTAALMVSANTCILPAEVENVLKLTSKDVEQLSFNQIYQGQIGAGALDTGDAVEFVNEMKKVNGNATIKNHIFYRFNFKLININNKLTFQNVTFSDANISDFVAKNQIAILPNSVFRPNALGSLHLGINPSISVACAPAPKYAGGNENTDMEKLKSNIRLYPNPNKGVFELSLNNSMDFKNNNVTITVLDIHGRKIHEEKVVTDDNELFTIPLNVGAVPDGVYFVKISVPGYFETLKFIKK